MYTPGNTRYYECYLYVYKNHISYFFFLKNEISRLHNQISTPSWNSALVYSNKIRLINLFLFLFDVVYAINIATMVTEAPMLILGSIHIYLDPYCFFSINKSMEIGTLYFLNHSFLADNPINGYVSLESSNATKFLQNSTLLAL